MEDEVIVVEGMHGAKCKETLEKALENLVGVTCAEADVGAGTVDVTYDTDLTNLEAIRNCIEGEGYYVVA